MPRPRLFIGSSTPTLKVVGNFVRSFGMEIESIPWKGGDVFEPGGSTLASLVAAAAGCDYGLFIFGTDDRLYIPKNTVWLPRDNVVFELGLFMGNLGKENVFFATPTGEIDGRLKIPSDLAGATHMPYLVSTDEDGERKFDVSVASSHISEIILKRWKKKEAGTRAETEKKLRKKADIIRKILSAQCKVLIKGAPAGAIIRGFCHTVSMDNRHLIPFACMSEIGQQDRQLTIPVDPKKPEDEWWVIVKAFRNQQFESNDVDWARENVSKKIKGQLWSEMKGIMAFPVQPLSDSRGPIGTVDFNSNCSIEELGWKKRDYQQFMAAVADLIYAVLNED